MNYLSHIFLSYNHPQIQVGNYIGDFVKGNRLSAYPPGVREGIKLHRKIDSYTDSHPVVCELVVFLRPHFGRFSAIVLDMYFDYFFAANFSNYSTVSLNLFSIRFYFYVLCHYWYLPVRVKRFIFHFVLTHRLKKYESISGLHESLQIMARYKIPSLDPDKIIAFLVDNHDYMLPRFHAFFPQLVAYVEGQRVRVKEI